MMPLNIFSQNWTSLLTLFATLIVVMMVYFQSTIESEANRKRVIAITAMIAFLASVVAAVVSFVSSQNADKEQKQLQANIVSTKNLAAANAQLSKQIKTLQELNNDVAVKTQILAINTDEMTRQGQDVIEEIKGISLDLKKSTNNIYEEQTGGKSVPEIVSYTDWVRDFTADEDTTRTNSITGWNFSPSKRIVRCWVRNYGNNTLTNIRIKARGGNLWFNPPLADTTIQIINRFDSVMLFEYCIDSKCHQDINTTNRFIRFDVSVKWKANYNCYFSVLYDQTQKGVYTDFVYKGRTLYRSELLEKISKESKLQLTDPRTVKRRWSQPQCVDCVPKKNTQYLPKRKQKKVKMEIREPQY